MPKVTLTEEQKRVRRFEKRSEFLADGLEKFMRQNKLSQQDLATELRLSRNTVRKLLDEEYDIRIPIETVWRMFDLAGVRMVRGEQGDA